MTLKHTNLVYSSLQHKMHNIFVSMSCSLGQTKLILCFRLPDRPELISPVSKFLEPFQKNVIVPKKTQSAFYYIPRDLKYLRHLKMF